MDFHFHKEKKYEELKCLHMLLHLDHFWVHFQEIRLHAHETLLWYQAWVVYWRCLHQFGSPVINSHRWIPLSSVTCAIIQKWPYLRILCVPYHAALALDHTATPAASRHVSSMKCWRFRFSHKLNYPNYTQDLFLHSLCILFVENVSSNLLVFCRAVPK